MDMDKITDFVTKYKVLLMAFCMGFLLMTCIGFGAIYGSNKICKDSGGIKVINPEGVKVCVIEANVQRDYCISLNDPMKNVFYVPINSSGLVDITDKNNASKA